MLLDSITNLVCNSTYLILVDGKVFQAEWICEEGEMEAFNGEGYSYYKVGEFEIVRGNNL